MTKMEATSRVKAPNKRIRGSVIGVAKLVISHPIVGKMRSMQAKAGELEVSEQERK